ncbi:hypothetical protein BDA96_10G297400 [Sorghum bicolor]|uniref:Uncharacterized protein n=2 Tax=Sorghum bicolor TaxID=4558 RepID=A0A921Q4Y4_SORBI|nr:hypothetical protein BDA96_10G297400 [Sorghum bicolor]KXG20627.1 hypothetical protein SORBI_3010G229200 [Sorghum bicolor]
MLGVNLVQKGKGASLPEMLDLFHEHWIGPRLLSFQVDNYSLAHLNSNRSRNIVECHSAKAPK